MEALDASHGRLEASEGTFDSSLHFSIACTSAFCRSAERCALCTAVPISAKSAEVKSTAVHMCVFVWTQVVGGGLAPTLSSMLVGSTTFVGATPPISLLLPHFARPVNDMGPVQVDSNESRVLIDLKLVLYLG